ncbi:tRNA(Ile)-lysidine synthase [Shimia gijangensis]|uniref:tRNA(Ile)-lysidine synthase n=1 Tax=Shimia gijangensis TaxID=1470563 RepID=A0A1M6IFK6_9RHOB|nr:tRNA lysidine(34) synthetase TilS [Shimia gijangensis]SHJ33221.1 tRNA(Ile)-lysidine synthase [Shimia gijangensis]
MPVTATNAELAASLDLHFLHGAPRSVGVAVSGGSDSVALLHLVVGWAQSNNVGVRAVTIDHGLRAEARSEIEHVAGICQSLGVPHDVALWSDWDGSGNLQAMARDARYRLLADWAADHGVDQIVLGHTQNDQAETFLMRLSRKAGVDGLAAMDSHFQRNGQNFGRPLLDVSRQTLRAYLSEIGETWCEDASNSDPRFSRVRAREVLGHLASLDIDAGALAAVSNNLSMARSALEFYTDERARQCCTLDRGDIVFDRATLMRPPFEIENRLVTAAIKWVSGAPYAPRSEAMMGVAQALMDQKTTTLSGCLVMATGQTVRIMREYKAVQDLVTVSPRWDRWALTGPWHGGLQVRALGKDGLRTLTDWRAAGLPRASLLASPSVWQDDTLIAAPLAAFGEGWTASLLQERAKFLSLTG